MATAMVAKALLRQANERLDVLHERLLKAGVGVFVGAEGKSWEPGCITSLAVKPMPGKGEGKVVANA